MTNRPSAMPRRDIAASPARRLGPEDAALFDEQVVPRYLSLFGERMLAMLAEGPDARACHLGCRTGYPDRDLIAKLPGVHVHGCDPSEHAIARARRNAAGVTGLVADYRVVDPAAPLPYPNGAFSHAFTRWTGQSPSQWRAERGAPE